MLKNYLLIAIRNLWKSRTFTAINIFGLALGIGCSLAIFMIVRHESSFDTFHPKHDRIYRLVTEVRYEQGTEYQSGTPLVLPPALRVDFPDIKKVATVQATRDAQIDVPDEKPTNNPKRFKEEDGVFYINPDFFDIFKFNWIYGNAAVVLTRPNQTALTKETAEKYFGSWQNAIGKTIKKDNAELLQVAGILENPPLNTDFPLKVVISYGTFSNTPFYRNGSWGSVSSRSQCYFLLPDHLTIGQFKARMPSFRKKYLEDDDNDFYVPQPLTDLHFNTDYSNYGRRTISKQTLWSLSLIGIFLLVLACINFINLATAQATKRSREVGIRKVLGSQRWQLALQLMGETFFVTITATLLAIGLVTLLSPLSKEILNKAIPLQPLYSLPAMIFVVCTTLLITVCAGFYPAIIISGFRPVEALKNKITQHTTSGISLRRFLVTSQFVIAQVLIIGTIVVISQIDFFRTASLGFNKEAVITLSLPQDSTSRQKYESFRQQLLQQPGVESVSLSYMAPAARSTSRSSFLFDMHEKESFQLNVKAADAEYLKTYNLQLVAGRFYTPSDTMREMVVNETFLKKEGIRDPKDILGKYISLDDVKMPIVGVVKDFHTTSFREPIDAVGLTTFQRGYRTVGIKLRAAVMATTIPGIQKIFAASFPEYLYEHQFLDEAIALFYDQEQRLSNIFKVFAGIGILISCMGLYGLVLFMSVQRNKEVGVRKVLGASSLNIMMLFVREFVVLIGIAFIIASPVAWYAMHQWLQNFAYRIQISWWVFAVTGITALLIALFTISFQAIKAAVVNPVKSLRTE
jgi:putative ABC transport system permease protein